MTWRPLTRQECRDVIGAQVPGHTDGCEFIYVAPLTLNRARICRGDRYSVGKGWCYDDQQSAVRSLQDWSATGFLGEPEGWMRNPHDGRRRPSGDPTKEYIAW